MYIIRPLFNKYQKELVTFANTLYGRDFISSFGVKYNYPIVKVSPDGIHEQLEKGLYRATFHSRSPYLAKFAEVLTMIDIAYGNKYRVDNKELPLVIPHFMEETRLLRNKLPTIYLDSKTFNPDTSPGTTSIDGMVRRSGVNEAFSTIRSGAGTSAFNNGADTVFLDIDATTTTDQYGQIRRSIYLFDSSSLTSSATKVSATFSIAGDGTSGATTLGTLDLALVDSTPASNTTLAASDYGNVGTTRQATDFTGSSWVTTNNTYNDWTLNATGLGNVSLTGVSKFGVRHAKDVDNSAPVWASSGVSTFFGYYTVGTSKPKLVVIYTLPSSGYKNLLGVGI